MVFLKLCLVFFVINLLNATKIHKVFFYSENELDLLFKSKLCITEGDIPDDPDKSDSLSAGQDTSPVQQIHDLSAYNKIDYKYYVITEEGPSHNKWYTVGLMLGHPEWDYHSEEYKGYGSRIKDAQSNAAKNALSQTVFQLKPKSDEPDVNENNCPDKNIPSCQLNELLKDTNTKIIYNKYRPHRSDMYGVQLYLDHQIFNGEGFTLQSAKETAASKALTYLSEEDKDVCKADEIPDDSDTECTALKSPVTILHEVAQKYKYPIKFTVVGEEGPPHERIFTTTCKMADFESSGKGTSKKLSKQNASENMLEILSRLDYPLTFKTPETNGKKSRRKKNKIEKVSNGENENIEELNPIKVLYEWAAVNTKGEEPVFLFEDVAETEGNYKKFKADCIFKGLTTTGLGHKKKVAKHNAALGMLNLLKIPFSNDIKSKESLINRSYIPGLLKAPDYFVRAGITPENEEYDSRNSRLSKLNKKLQRAANHFYKETPPTNDVDLTEILKKNISNPVQSLDNFLTELKVKSQYIDLPINSNNTYSSILWLFTRPELICYGRTGGTTVEAQQHSAIAAITFLSELTLNVTSNETESSIE